MEKINFKDARAKLVLIEFVGYCSSNPEFNARDKYILYKALNTYIKGNEGGTSAILDEATNF